MLHTPTVSGLQEDNQKQQNLIIEMADQIKIMDDKINSLQSRVEILERNGRKRNVIIHGISDEFRSCWELSDFICTFLNYELDLQLEVGDIDFIKRVGRREINKARPIIIGMISYQLKLLIIQNSYKLRNSGIYIEHDYARNVLEDREILKKRLIDARKADKYAVLRYNKLIVKDSHSNTRKYSLYNQARTKKPTGGTNIRY
ncbi:uncharacterized protein [Rhodnius prolixus]|uniref:uncharacterized protein n=1 Tax=Rhodnius prolixus TaxID=13249 RepID=UPI003D18DAAA